MYGKRLQRPGARGLCVERRVESEVAREVPAVLFQRPCEGTAIVKGHCVALGWAELAAITQIDVLVSP